jgi:hypothetical protein
MTDRKGTLTKIVNGRITNTQKTKDRVTRTHLKKNATELGRVESSRPTRDTYKFRILETQCNVHSMKFDKDRNVKMQLLLRLFLVA